MRYYYQTAKTRALYESTDGLTGQLTDNPPNSARLAKFHWTVLELPLQVSWWPAQPIRQQSSAKKISIWAEWLCQSWHCPSEPSETSRWRHTPGPVHIQWVTLHIALTSRFYCFLWLCRSPTVHEHSGVVANCDHTSEWVHWVCAWIGIAMRWVTLRKPHLVFLLPALKIQFSLY